MTMGADQFTALKVERVGWEPLAQSIQLMIGLMSTMLMMLPVAWTYMGCRRRKGKEQSFILAIVLLPLAVTAIVLMVQNSLALAFALAGIVAGVRFRITLDDTIDAIYIFVAIGVGLAAGIEAVEIGAVVTLFFNYVIIFMWLVNYGEEQSGGRWFTRDWMNPGSEAEG